MAVFPNTGRAIRGSMRTPPPDVLRMMEAPPIEAPRPLFSPQQQMQPPQPQQMQRPPQPSSGPLVPPRMSPEEHAEEQRQRDLERRFRMWQDLTDEELEEKAQGGSGSTAKRLLKKKVTRAAMDRKLKKISKRIADAHKNLSRISRKIGEASGVGFQGAEGVRGGTYFPPQGGVPQVPQYRPLPSPIEGGGFSIVPRAEQGRSMGQIPDRGGPIRPLRRSY